MFKSALLILVVHRTVLAAIGVASSCPKTGADWQAVRLDIVRKAGWVEDSSEDLQLLQRCLPDAPKKIKACMEKTLEYLKYRSHFADIGLSGNDEDGRSLGHTIGDEEYFERTKLLDPFPKEFNVDQLLKTMQTAPMDFDKIENEIRTMNKRRAKKGAKPIEWLAYRSVQPANDSSGVMDRILLYVPGTGPKDKTERWIQFSPGSALINTILLAEENGRKRGYFKDLRSASGKNQDRGVHFEGKNLGSDSCTKCHISSGPFPIYPKVPVDSRFKDVLETMNERIRNYGVTRNEFEPKAPNAWPRLGDGKELSESVARKCIVEPLKRNFPDLAGKEFERRSQLTRDKIQASMQCATCHDGQQRGALIPPFRTWRPGVFHAVQSGKMPPGNNLSSNEAEMLADCLNRSYFGYPDADEEYQPGAFASYLTGDPCSLAEKERPEKGVAGQDSH